jgi:hypothetical protein
MMATTTANKDLSHEPPRSPRTRIGGYAVLGRTIDKCRAFLAGATGQYHFNCPLDNMLFSFKQIDGEMFKTRVESGGTDEEIAQWLDQVGAPRTRAEIDEWSDDMETVSLSEDPEKSGWFVDECKRLGLDPKKATLFDYLETDDAVSFRT